MALEKQKFDFEAHLKEKEIDAKYKFEQEKLEKLGDKYSSGFSSKSGFDVTKYVKLVPRFQEKEVDKYFQHFEIIANNLKWPKEHWTMLLQSSFVGKAREIYCISTYREV